MTTTVTPTATPHTRPDIDPAMLVAEIEQYLAAQTSAAPATAHPLVTKTTAVLVAEALGTAPAAVTRAASTVQPPPAVLRRLPTWALALPVIRNRFGGGGQHVTVAQHLQLTALLIERWGWAQGCLRTRGGICVEGAQFILLRLGYGNAATLGQATAVIHQLLANVGAGSLTAWNDHPDRTVGQVLGLLRLAARTAGGV